MPSFGLFQTQPHAMFIPAYDTWEAWSKRGSTRWRIPNPGKARNSANRLNTLLLELAVAVSNTWDDFSPRYQKALIEELKDEGRLFAEYLLGDGKKHEFVRTLDANGVGSISISFTETDVQWPLELCVLPDGDGEIFLGERFLVVDGPSSTNATATEVPSYVIRASRVSYAEDADLASACREHGVTRRPGIEELQILVDLAGDRANVSVLPEMPATRTVEGDRTLGDWLSTCGRIIHFNAHLVGRNPDNSFAVPRLSVRSTALVGAAEMTSSGDHDFSNRLVVLNACGSGMGSPEYRDSIPYWFHCNQADAIVSTMGPIEDRFATEFARILYTALREPGASITTAIVKAKDEMTARSGHPMALLYRLVGDGSFTLTHA